VDSDYFIFSNVIAFRSLFQAAKRKESLFSKRKKIAGKSGLPLPSAIPFINC
jgi:hypothetical protein